MGDKTWLLKATKIPQICGEPGGRIRLNPASTITAFWNLSNNSKTEAPRSRESKHGGHWGRNWWADCCSRALSIWFQQRTYLRGNFACWREVVFGASNSVHSIRAWRHADAILPRSYQGTPSREGAFGKNSELAFYADQFDVDCAPFPNPGTCKSGVYFADSKHGHRLHKYLRVLLP